MNVGSGVTQDYAEAVKWYRLAAEKGHLWSQNNLADMYKDGMGVTQNNIIAHAWYNVASANGHIKAGERRDGLSDLMSPTDISEAQTMAHECIKSSYVKCAF